MKSKIRKQICLFLSAVLCLHSTGMIAFAEETEPIEQTAFTPLLSCETDAVLVEEPDTEIEAELNLTSVDVDIEGEITTEDITLGAAFKNMTVESVSNDESTITLKLSGVPDMTTVSWTVPVTGTMEFSGSYFGSEEPVGSFVNVKQKIEPYKNAEPVFWPYFDAMIDNKDTFEMHIVLLPVSGEFTEEFSEYDISFGQDMKKAKITSFKKSNSHYEMIASVPKYQLDEGEDTYSYVGNIVLSEGSMINAAGDTNKEEISVTREYAPETVGRDLSEGDVNTIKNIVGGFGNTTLGTVTGVLSGTSTAFNIGWSMLGLCGVVPTDRSRHTEVMNKLDEIHSSIKTVNENVKYVQNLLHTHTLKLEETSIKMDSYYINDFNSKYTNMVSTMNDIIDGLTLKENQAAIAEAIEELSAQYRIPAEGSDRDMDFDELTAGDELSGEDFSAEAAPVPAETDSNTTEQVETAELPTDSLTEDILTEGEPDQTADDLLSDGEGGDEEFDLESLWVDRNLSDQEAAAFLWALDDRIKDLRQSPLWSIGDLVKQLKTDYKDVVTKLEDDGPGNPITAYCNYHKDTDNFSTTSLEEEILYEAEIEYQLQRALMILKVLDGVNSHNSDETLLKNAVFPDVTKGAVNKDGYPYCHLFGGYVRLYGGMVSSVYTPFLNKKVKSVSSLDKANVVRFFDRMQGRTVRQELEQAGMPGLKEMMNESSQIPNKELDSFGNKKYRGLAFEYERWGATWGEVVFEKRGGSFPWNYYYKPGLSFYDIYDFYTIISTTQFRTNLAVSFWIVSPRFVLWDEKDQGNYNGGVINAYYCEEDGAYPPYPRWHVSAPMAYLDKV